MEKLPSEVTGCLLELSKQMGKVIEILDRFCEKDAGENKDSGQMELPLVVEKKPTITLENVRGVLAGKSRDGHTAEVRALILKFGASRLSEIDPKDYEAVLREAEVIGNA